PDCAIAFTPFAWLGPRAGGVLWGCLGLAFYALGLCRFLRDVLPDSWTTQQRDAFLLLSLVGGIAGLWNGQSNPLLVGLFLVGASFVVRGCWWRAALFLALPMSLKLTPLPMVLLLCALWPRRLGGRVLLVLGLLLLVPFLTRPASVVCEQYRGFV